MFKDCSNITFTGNMDYYEIPGLLQKCEYGINYVPNKYPFNILTAVKATEYAAAGLKIISNKYAWIKSFEKRSGGSFFYLRDDFKNFTPEDIKMHEFIIPDMQLYDWDNIIDNTGILNLINSFS